MSNVVGFVDADGFGISVLVSPSATMLTAEYWDLV
jgi:hypothetical protein